MSAPAPDQPHLGHAMALSSQFGVSVEVSQVPRFTQALNALLENAFHRGVQAGYQACLNQVKSMGAETTSDKPPVQDPSDSQH